MKKKKVATAEEILNGPRPKFMKAIMIPNGKHSPTYICVPSHTPPSKKDLEFKSAHNRQGFPTG